MDLVRQTFTQLRDLFLSMPASGRFTLVTVAALVLAGLGTLVYVQAGSSNEYLLGGKFFTPEELARNQEALRKAGLNDFRIDGQRLAVPKKELDQYTAIVAVAGSLPADFSAEFDRMQEKLSNPFTTESHRREMLEEARKVRLARILRSIPELEEAYVEWDRGRQTSMFQRNQVATAQVSVRPRQGQNVSPQLVRSLRYFVAGAVSGVKSDHVTVLDMNSGRVYAPAADGSADENYLLDVRKQRTLDYETAIRKALEYIPDVAVTVNVELEPTRISTERSQMIEPKGFQTSNDVQTRTSQSQQKPARAEPGARSNQPQSVSFAGRHERSDTFEEQRESSQFAPSFKTIEKSIEGLQPKSVTVAVGVPEDYYRDVALAGGLKADTDEFKTKVAEVQRKTEQEVLLQVQTLLPLGAPPEAVKVTSVTRVPRKAPTAQASWIDTASGLGQQWGGVVGLLLLAAWALRTVNKSLGRLPPPEPLPATPPPPNPADADPDDVEADKPPAERTKRDDLQTLVRDNPEVAAAVLSRWITTAG